MSVMWTHERLSIFHCFCVADFYVERKSDEHFSGDKEGGRQADRPANRQRLTDEQTRRGRERQAETKIKHRQAGKQNGETERFSSAE